MKKFISILCAYFVISSGVAGDNDYGDEHIGQTLPGNRYDQRMQSRGVKTSFTKTKSSGTKSSYGLSQEHGMGQMNPFNFAGGYGMPNTRLDGYGRADHFDKIDNLALQSGGYSEQTSKYKGGCNQELPGPMNGAMKCSTFTGCRATCNPNYKFPNGETQLFINCHEGQWQIEGTEWENIPPCEPICLPVCENNGICVAPHQCNCPENFSGPQCQFQSKPCLNYPALPKNSRRVCRSSTCTVTCSQGHIFPDGSSIQQLICKNGNWIPAQEKFVSLPDCDPTCSPQCQNGGKCLSFNMCLCTPDFRGPQCQFSADVCKPRKLNFNGGYNCSGTSDSFTCSLSCPEGGEFEFQPASAYTCSYSTGIYLPSPIPQCLYGPNTHVVGLGETGSNFFNTSYKEIQSGITFEGHSQSGAVNLDGQFGDNLLGAVTVVERRPQPGSCFTWGGYHFKTFDGKIYSFNSKCSYTLIKDDVDSTFSIIEQNDPSCADKIAQCHKIITIFYQGKEYLLKQSDKGVPIFMTGKNVLPIPSQVPGLRTEMIAHYIVISLDTVGVKLKWDGHLLVQVDVKESLWNRTSGLCGKIDGHSSNDIMSQDGTIPKNIITMLNSWQTNQLGEACNTLPRGEHTCLDVSSEKAAEAKKFCSKLLADKRFSACHSVLDITVLSDACRWDYCSCSSGDSANCACDTINVYVKECLHKGIKSLANWRDENTCPMVCSGGRIYMSCAPTGGQETCGTNVDDNVGSDFCEEGCYCPKGTVSHENKCIPREQCPCRLRGKDFKPGATVPKDCNTCTCSDGKWICTQVSCGARCSALGDPHYVTFDGKRYDFMGQCSYYLVKNDNFTIEAENVACTGAISLAMNFPISVSTGLPSCTKTVTIRVNGQVIKLKQNQELSVNGKEITKLPNVAGGVAIRTVSSIFTVVELLNGVTVWWDGLTRAYVNVPASLKGKTSGLCGTFNENQKDDFLTPENDVEHSVTQFANKWKTNEKCNDVPEKLKQHPCDVNIQNRAIAESHCKKIKSQIFGSCHFFVDPEPFYQDCLYDMCSCEAKLSTCLCPMIAGYAHECAVQGIRVDWRNEIKECGVHCSGGQTYQVCGNSCTRTCYDVTTRPDCKEQCVEGCNCPEGQSLDDQGECIPISQCHCQLEGLDFPPGYKEVRPASKAPEICTCSNAIWNCKPATPEEIKKYPKASDKKTMCSGEKNFEFTTCENPEPVTCKNMHRHDGFSAAICHAGCQCKEGYVLDSRSKTCVKPKDCPCHHGGKSYVENAAVQSDCNTCTCKNGRWECTDRQCTAECTAWGDSHFKTFDGKMYDYQGQCDYVLSKGHLSSEDTFQISIQNVPCGSTGVSCSKSLTIKIGMGSQQESITLVRHKSIQSPQIFKRFTVRTHDLFVIIEASDLGLIIHWDKGTRVYVKVDPRWKGKVNGLCGNYNHNELDDFQTPSGGVPEVSAQLFGDSWKMQQYCPDAQEITDTCEKRPDRRTWALKKCGILKTSVFSACHSEVPVDNYIEKCVFDTCACDEGGDCECLCTALAAYSQECNSKGVPVKWRTQDLCPIQCDERCSQYSPCVSSCPLETCDNLLLQHPLTKLCKEDSCVEGCAPKPCPPDYVYMNSSYLECVPKSVCKPVCLEVEGITYYEGDQMEEDECHTCFCSRGKKTCKGQPCPETTIRPEITTPNQLDSTPICKPGWTDWINQDKLIPSKTAKQTKESDVEPLPTNIIMNQLKGKTRCDPTKITNIECRTVSKHIPSKETGLNVECSLEKGLICSSQSRDCPDFEIRVLCECDEEITTTPALPVVTCDTENSHVEHPINCHLFYVCQTSENGLSEVVNSCGDEMMFNPKTKICDWPKNVIAIKPQCSKEYPSSKCPPGFLYAECAVNCDRLCHYHSFTVKQRGQCVDGKCTGKCVPKDKEMCNSGYFWNSDDSCIRKADCVCKANDGSIVKPGQVYKEDNCNSCQCVDNFYTCKDLCEESVSEVEGAHEASTVEELVPIISTVTPPKECLPDMFMDLIQGDQALADEAFSASSYFDDLFLPKYARFDSNGDSGKSWKPKETDKSPYLEIDLGRQEPLYGVIVKGNPKYNQYVTSYKVSYIPDTLDKFVFVRGNDKRIQVFRGSSDASLPSKQLFATPFEARKIRIYPQTWHEDAALRVELVGCSELKPTAETSITTSEQELCIDDMGLANGIMSQQQISVSSEHSRHTSKAHLKINETSAWQPFTNTPTEWVMFDFLEPRNITGVTIQGGSKGWVTQYKLKYSTDKKHWNPIVDSDRNEVLFDGNFDHKTAVTNLFKMPINAKYLKLEPTKWENNIQLKVEPKGCYLPYPIIEEEIGVVEKPKPIEECNYCPGISKPDEKTECLCHDDTFWDGEKCASRSDCPCVVEHMAYKVGQSYVKDDCKECFCKIGGVEHCMDKVCEKCQNGLRSVISSTCACVCVPCAQGEVLCPTSNICIAKSKWCDGVTDCPDDEADCVTTAIPPSTEKPKEECPVPICAPGYRLQEKVVSKGLNYQNFLATMFNRKPVKQTTKTTFSYTKTRPNKNTHRLQRPSITEPSSEIREQQKCKEYICVPIVVTPVCPPASCPPGYTPVYNPTSTDIEFCAGYKCNLPDAICNVTGRTFNTFDNTEFKYDICNHVLARDLLNNEWDVALRKICDENACHLKVYINHEIDSFIIYPDLKNIEFNDVKYTTDQMEKISSQSQTFAISRLGETLLFSSTKHGFWVTIDNLENIKVGVANDLMGKVDGLCGYYSGTSDDDKRKPDGTLAKTSIEFGDSWTYGDQADCEIRTCPKETENKAIEICNKVKDHTLAPCSNAINTESFISRCLETTCTCLQDAKGNETAEDHCRCSTLQSFVIDCMQTDSSIEIANWRAQHNCPISCKAPLMPHDCYRRPCELTCETITDPNACPKLETVCFPGCYCPPGFVRQGESCIQPPSCKDCECNVLPHLQYVTYDESNFTVNGNCVYVMSRDVAEDLKDEHIFQVLVTNHPCENKANKMCIGKITILFEGRKIHILRDEIRNRLKMIIDSERIYDFAEVSDWLEVKETKSKHLKMLLKAVQVHISVYYPSLGVSVKAPSHKYGGKLEGLCGDCNRDRTNDMKLPTGELAKDVDDFAVGWLYDKIPGQTKETCAQIADEPCKSLPANADPCQQLLDVHKFGLCHPLIDPGMFIEWCKKDVCGGDLGQACTAIEAYAKECMSSDICVNWRTDLCPAKTCPPGQEYQACDTSCPETCETVKKREKKCQDVPVEGCFCPEGKVMLNNTCVEERECDVCDDEGHHPGDTWQKDACTNCSCVGTNVKCETKHCPKVETLCEDGYTSVKVQSGKNECCEKYICVPASTAGPTCEPPQQLKCNPNQEMKLVKKPDGCQKFVCECKPVNECTPIEKLTNDTIEEGYEKVINDGGCCPTVEYVCRKELCPKPQECPMFYNIKTMEIPEKCCPIYTCEAPKKCIVELSYTNSAEGGEKLRNEHDKQKLLKDVGEKWRDGPCRECECFGTPSEGYHSNCLQKNCPLIKDSEDNDDYLLDYEPIVNECCSAIKRIACKYDGKVRNIDERWPVNGDYCAFMKCVNTTSGVQKTTERLSCDTKCELGYEYVAPNPEGQLCCGSCKPVACVVDGAVKKVGEQWMSNDYCTTFVCIDDNGMLRVDGKVQTCLAIPTDQSKDYVFESYDVPEECCKKHKTVACKVENVTYQIGETWQSPDLDLCKKLTCVKNVLGEVAKQETKETCNEDCSKGWEYVKSRTSCCGECVPVFCVVGDVFRRPGETWKSEDACTTFTCEKQGDQLTVVSNQESCPNVDDCSPENMYLKGCCKHCNITSASQKNCAPVKISADKTIGLVRILKAGSGVCTNVQTIKGFTECIGSCESSTLFNIDTATFESSCSCCRAIDYDAVVIELTCEDRTQFKKEINVPSACSCDGCAAPQYNKQVIPASKTFSKTKTARKVR